MGCWGKEKGQTPAGKRAKNKRLKMPRGTAKAETCEADRQICHCHCRCSTGSRPAAHRRMCKTIPRTSFGAAFCSSGITADTTMCYVQSPTFPPPSPDNIFRGFVGLLLEALSSPHSLAPGWASKAISPPSTGINGTWERRRKTVSSEIISFNRNGEGWATGSRSPCDCKTSRKKTNRSLCLSQLTLQGCSQREELHLDLSSGADGGREAGIPALTPSATTEQRHAVPDSKIWGKNSHTAKRY